MPRKEDRFREYVTFLDEKKSKWKCQFCNEDYSGGGTRIKAHLAKARRYGIKECGSVDDRVRAKAWEALCGKQVQDQDGAGNGNVSPRHRQMNTVVPDDAYRPMNHQPALRDDSLPLSYLGLNESCEARLVEVNLSRHLLLSNQSISFLMGHRKYS